MSRVTTAALLALGLCAASAMPVLAQTDAAASGPNGTSATKMVNAGNDTTSKVTADHKLRTSKLIGSTVYNDHNDSIGSIDDILLSNNERPVAVLSVGGFLGMGDKLVEVEFKKLKINTEGHVVLSGATKDSLKAMMGYHYDNRS